MTEQTQSPVVYIGRKPLRVYVSKAEEALRQNSVVTLAARGVLISRAILVASRVQHTRPPQMSFQVSRERGKDGIERDVPSLEIVLSSDESDAELSPYGNVHYFDEKHPRKEGTTAVEDVLPTISG